MVRLGTCEAAASSSMVYSALASSWVVIEPRSRVLLPNHPCLGHGADEVSISERADVAERLGQGAAPGVGAVGDAVCLASSAHLPGHLAEALGRQTREEVVLDLSVEAAAEDGDRPADLVVVRRLDLHGVPLAASVRARAFRVRR